MDLERVERLFRIACDLADSDPVDHDMGTCLWCDVSTMEKIQTEWGIRNGSVDLLNHPEKHGKDCSWALAYVEKEIGFVSNK